MHLTGRARNRRGHLVPSCTLLCCSERVMVSPCVVNSASYRLVWRTFPDAPTSAHDRMSCSGLGNSSISILCRARRHQSTTIENRDTTPSSPEVVFDPDGRRYPGDRRLRPRTPTPARKRGARGSRCPCVQGSAGAVRWVLLRAVQCRPVPSRVGVDMLLSRGSTVHLVCSEVVRCRCVIRCVGIGIEGLLATFLATFSTGPRGRHHDRARGSGCRP